jgi:hypothetical protein
MSLFIPYRWRRRPMVVPKELCLATYSSTPTMFDKRSTEKKRMDYQKDKDVVKSVKLWFKEIEDKGGKTMFVEDATLTGFAYGWCTKFQLKVNVVHADSIHTNSSIIQEYLSGFFLHCFRPCPRTPISTAWTRLTRQHKTSRRSKRAARFTTQCTCSRFSSKTKTSTKESLSHSWHASPNLGIYIIISASCPVRRIVLF